MSDDGDRSPKLPRIPPPLKVKMPELPKIDLPKIPDFKVPTIEPIQLDLPALPDLPVSPLVTAVEANYASEFYKRLMAHIVSFNDALDQEHEVGIRLVSFGQAMTFHLERMGYHNPSLIMFYGKTDDGDPVELVQHVSQISVLLVKLKRKDPSEPKRPIGFNSDAT